MTSRQEKIRLDMAIRIFCHQKDPDIVHQEACRSYLHKRYRVAADLLTEKGDSAGLRRLLQEEWLSEEEKKKLLQKAVQEKKTDCVGILAGADTVKGGHGVLQSSASLWQRILSFAGRYLDREYPYLGQAMHLMTCRQKDDIRFCGTDGFALYTEEKALQEQFLADSVQMTAKIAHSLLHGMWCHPLMAGEARADSRWEACCDCIVEWTLEEKLKCPLSLSDGLRRQRKKVYDWMKREGIVTTGALYERMKMAGEESVKIFASWFLVDDHCLWYTKKYSPEQWHKRLGSIKRQSAGGFDGARGGINGESMGSSLKYRPPQASEYDYHRFLEQFMVYREERKLDLSSFDMQLYTYSRQHYEKAVLLEPPETSEVRRLQEIVIAIDTSGSCSGEIVQQFLKETFSILEKKELFFRHMRIHILQCDSMIQAYRLIESEEAFLEYQKECRITGFGNTDFRPVFDWIEKKRADGTIKDMKGLIYFTDGDGIYPRSAPDYETAFVYLNDQLDKGKAPAYVRTLNLHINREFANIYKQEQQGITYNDTGEG